MQRQARLPLLKNENLGRKIGAYLFNFGRVLSLRQWWRVTWTHNYINEMTEHEFVLVTIGANAESRGKFKYELADNVVEVKEVFLDDAFQVSGNSDFKETFNDTERQALKDLLSCQSPDWEVLFDIFRISVRLIRLIFWKVNCFWNC